MGDLIQIGHFLLGTFIPIFLTLLVPPTAHRIGSCVYAAIGVAIFVGLLSSGTSFAIGMATGFLLGATKMAFGLRFIL